METNCARCGYILLTEDATCPNCVRMHEMTVRLREQSNAAVKVLAHAGRDEAPAQISERHERPMLSTPYESPSNPNPPGYRWSRFDGKWMPEREIARQDRNGAFLMLWITLGMLALGFIAIAVLSPH